MITSICHGFQMQIDLDSHQAAIAADHEILSKSEGWEYASVNGKEVPRPKAGACGGV
jgi:hypothetical protein